MYKNKTDDDIVIFNLVAGGKRTNLAQYPFNVKFLNSLSLCGGIIIATKHVLTAAHCFDSSEEINEMQVISNSESTYSFSAVFHDVWHFMIHEQYGVGDTFANDIAVIIIHDQFKYGARVQKAILVHHNNWMSENETNFIVAGWGDTENDGESNYQTMRETELRFISPKNCSAMSQSVLSPDVFCLFGDGKRDTMRGDSGGGVLWNDQIVGITSHGKSINVPGMYANVFYFLPWIENATMSLHKKFLLDDDVDKKHPKVVGGKPADLKRYPHSARFYNDEAMCAGVIFSSWSVLTSAHCLDHNDDVSFMAVVVGSQSLADFEGQWVAVTKAVVHENYNISAQFSCDLAILFVDEKFRFGDTVQRVILAQDDQWMKPHEGGFHVSGWGRTSYHGKVSPELLMTTLHFIDRAKCEKLNAIKLTPDMFCLYGSGESDACKGDSGGGVIWKGMLVGITSHGNGGCSQINKPTMFANMWYLRNWIKKKVNTFVRKSCTSTS
ncbi:plasma kallikrein [Amyelois transitella]|uniref:plasma kallikrein n=1 Tax=Amyelois transitella TaxID=680683 RepID=UPI00298F50AC|nr:plasma kallikrein [Amyelois transitella]